MKGTTDLFREERRLAEEWLSGELGRIWLVAERSLRQMQAAGLRAPPDAPVLAEIEGVLGARRAARHGGEAVPFDEAELAAALRRCEEAVFALRRAAPIGRLAENLGLRPLELETLLCATAPHIDAPLADLFDVLRGSPARAGVDLALVAQLFHLSRSDRLALLDAIDPDRPLLSWRLVQITAPDEAAAYRSVHYRAIQPTFDLLSILCGRGELAPALKKYAKLRRSTATLADLVLDEPIGEQLRQLCATTAAAQEQGRIAEMPWLLLLGPRGIGKTEIAARIAAYAARPLITFNLEAVPAAQREERLRSVQREALLRGALLYLGPLSEVTLEERAQELSWRMAGYPAPLVLGLEVTQPPRLVLERPFQEFRLSLPVEATRLRLWERSVPAEVRGADLDLAGLSRRFRLTHGEILDTARDALAMAGLSDRSGTRLITHADLREGIERRLRSELGDVARRLTITATWDDLVLPPEDMDRIEEFVSRSLYATRVYEEWGLGDRVGYGKGLIALFSGPPGTGKTMLAGLIARALDLDIYQVDLAQVVSKWVGETEKQLARVFDQAERSHAVLLFDEADALLARRTEVKSSNDRYGNLAVNYLLQRLEQFSGAVILTTNKESGLDEALRRRLSLHLHLLVPPPEERERLWWSMLPSSVPIARNLNLRQLAQEYELTGGYIKNVAVRAAFLAASEGGPIHMGILRRAVALEMEDMGRLVTRTARSDQPGAVLADDDAAMPAEGDGAIDFAEG